MRAREGEMERDGGESKSIFRLAILLGNSTAYIEKTGGEEVDNPDEDRNDRG